MNAIDQPTIIQPEKGKHVGQVKRRTKPPIHQRLRIKRIVKDPLQFGSQQFLARDLLGKQHAWPPLLPLFFIAWLREAEGFHKKRGVSGGQSFSSLFFFYPASIEMFSVQQYLLAEQLKVHQSVLAFSTSFLKV